MIWQRTVIFPRLFPMVSLQSCALSYSLCVLWESSTPVSATDRARIPHYDADPGSAVRGHHSLFCYQTGALSGVKYFLIPNPANFSWMTVVAAMGQMFYSLSIAMGILITFGSYMKKDVSIEGSTKNVEIFDTAIAIMAGLMIIPAVFAFSGGDPDTLQAGPSLMFITLPKSSTAWAWAPS